MNNTIYLLEGTIAAEAKGFVFLNDGNLEVDEIISSLQDKTQVKKDIEKHFQGNTHPCGYRGIYLKTKNALQAQFYKIHTKRLLSYESRKW